MQSELLIRTIGRLVGPGTDLDRIVYLRRCGFSECRATVARPLQDDAPRRPYPVALFEILASNQPVLIQDEGARVRHTVLLRAGRPAVRRLLLLQVLVQQPQ